MDILAPNRNPFLEKETKRFEVKHQPRNETKSENDNENQTNEDKKLITDKSENSNENSQTKAKSGKEEKTEESKEKTNKETEESKEKTDLYEQFKSSIPKEGQAACAILYANMGACYQRLEEHDHTIQACTNALKLSPHYTKALIRRAHSYEKKDELDAALEDYKLLCTLDPKNKEARKAAIRLPKQIAERNERLKNEAMEKLKEVGNKFLGLFGLSTDNFQFQQDQSGGYSVNMKQ